MSHNPGDGQASPVCLIDWLMLHFVHRQVVDMVRRSDIFGDLLFENRMLLPVKNLRPTNNQKIKPLWNHQNVSIQLAVLSKFHLVDVAYHPKQQKNPERLLLKFTLSDIPDALVIGEAELDNLIFQLRDMEIRKYEP
jgi:hypothetical protein